MQNVFTTLIVRLAHHARFIERDFYKDAAAYEDRNGGKCIVLLRVTAPGAGRLSVFFEGEVNAENQTIFLDYVFQHLQRRAIPGSITRQREYHCRRCSYKMDDAVVEYRLKEGRNDIVCPQCDERQALYDLLLRDNEDLSEALRGIDDDARNAKSRELALVRLEGKREHDEHDVFLSYNSSDRIEVIRLAESMKAVGLRPWLDVWDLVPGRPWQESLERAIDRLPCAAICLGNAGTGPWHEREIRAVLEEFVRIQKRVLPVLMPGAPQAPELPLFLRAFPWVDLRDKDVSKGAGLKLLVAGILDVPPSEIGEQTLDAMLVTRIKERQRRRVIGSTESARLVFSLDQDFSQFDGLSVEAVRAQIAERLDIPSQYLRVANVTEGSVRITIEFDEAWEAATLMTQVVAGNPDALRQFDRLKANKEAFMRENHDKVPELKDGVTIGDVKLAAGASLVIGSHSAGVAGGMHQSSVTAASPHAHQHNVLTKENVTEAIRMLGELVTLHIENAEELAEARKLLGGAEAELEEEMPDQEKIAKRTGRVAGLLKKTGEGAKWFNDVVKFGSTVAEYCGKYGPLILTLFASHAK